MCDKSSIAGLLWTYRARQAALPFTQSPSGWLADEQHWSRSEGDFCPFQCQFCDEQRALEREQASVSGPITPLS